MVDDVLLHLELLKQTSTLQCFSCLHKNGFLIIVGLHFIFQHRIGGEVLHNFLLSRNISNFALSRIVDEIVNIHWVPVSKLLNLLFEVLDHLSDSSRTGVTSASVVRIRQWRKQLQIVSSFTSMLQATTAMCIASRTSIFSRSATLS